MESDFMTTTTKISMVMVAKELGMKQIAQYLGKTFKEEKENDYMVTVEQCVDFLKTQVMRKLKYADQADEMLKSKKYLEFTDKIDVATTTKKANVQKKGTIQQLRMFLKMKGLSEDFQKMLDAGQLEEQGE